MGHCHVLVHLKGVVGQRKQKHRRLTIAVQKVEFDIGKSRFELYISITEILFNEGLSEIIRFVRPGAGVRRARIPAGLHLDVLVHLPALRAPCAGHQPRRPSFFRLPVSSHLNRASVGRIGRRLAG